MSRPPRPAPARAAALGLLASAALAACSATPSPPGETRADPLAGVSPPAARLARAALSEWVAWGRPTVEGWPDALPPGTTPPPDHFERILMYWDAVPGGRGVAARHRATRDALYASLATGGGGAAVLASAGAPAEQGSADPASLGDEAGVGAAAAGAIPVPGDGGGPPALSLWAYPAWSAAFVGHVFRAAGVSDGLVPPAQAHATYVDALLGRAATDPEGAPFRPHAPEERAPRPGDLVCADRSRGAQLHHWTERLAEAGGFRPMHCDVVTRGGPGVVEAVGGNVLDSVALRRFPADQEGRLLPAPPDKSRFFVVFENRLR